MQTSLVQATYRISEQDLEFMVLDRDDIPSDFERYQVIREGTLDNAMMAEHGFAGSTADKFRSAGRATGFMREFGPTSDMGVHDGLNFVGATVAHLFDTPDSVVDSSTVIDFRVGRILGVAFVGSVGDHQRLDLASELARSLEKRIVKVVLGAF